MSKRLGITTTLFLTLLAAAPSRGEEASITVPADRSWTRTGVDVRAGDIISFRASGEIDWGKGLSGPEGRRAGEGGIFRPLGEEPACGLIGRIGALSFFIGASAEIEAAGDGELELGINDDKVSDNAGEFRVRIRTARGQGSFGASSGKPFESGGSRGSYSGDDWDRYRDDDHGRDRDFDDRDRDWFWWRGSVDGADQLVIQGETLHVKHLDKAPIQSQKHRFSDGLPDREVDDLRLDAREGRGRVRLLQKPSRANDWTAIVLLDDIDERGADWYEIRLSWERPRRGGRGDREALFRWRGRVDIGCRISIRGDDSSVRDMGGRGTQERFADFTAALPSRDVAVSLRKVRGRGKVQLVETPERDNGYTAVVEVEDAKGGADDYEFELSWRR